MRHAGEVVTREKIAPHAWDDNYDPASNVIGVYIARLRKRSTTLTNRRSCTIRGGGLSTRGTATRAPGGGLAPAFAVA
ncbi:MAG: winged helix-turn-helix domain-containing protein [Gemmatimonadetes bacterium]|nr:winged helix-turn-helix domain-containing protein [Gemmatimonadota bacterium]